MTKQGDDRQAPGKGGARESREDRLRAALRANLQRRKMQARARAEQAQTDQPDRQAGTNGNTGGDDS